MSSKLDALFEAVSHTAAWNDTRPDSVLDRNVLGDSPLHTVCSWGEVEPVRLLLLSGADPNARGDLNATPLFNAIVGGSQEVIQLLLDYGADPAITNSEGWSPAHYARMLKKSPSISRLLEPNIKTRRRR